jgi:multiple RNA-binding domain-containing protein 1
VPSSVQPSKTSSPDDKFRAKNDDQLDQFLEVMQPRAKKGPSWANDAKQLAFVDSNAAGEDLNVEDNGGRNREEGLSDLDWMRRHMTKNIDSVDKAFEQSDDEAMDDKQQEKV